MPENPSERIQVRSKRKQDWFWLDNEFITDHARVVGPMAALVYVALCKYADKDDQNCWPSIRLLSEILGMSRDVVMLSVHYLEVALLVKVERKGEHQGFPNEYFILPLPDKVVSKHLIESHDCKKCSRNHQKRGSGTPGQPLESGTPGQLEAVRQGNSKEDTIKEDLIEKIDVDTSQDLLPWMQRTWEVFQSKQPKITRRKFNPGPHPDQYERQEAAMGKVEYRRAITEYIYGPNNRGMVNFAKMMAETLGPLHRPPNGDGHHQKSITEMMMEKHPEWATK
jgi:hypothetical protein